MGLGVWTWTGRNDLAGEIRPNPWSGVRSSRDGVPAPIPFVLPRGAEEFGSGVGSRLTWVGLRMHHPPEPRRCASDVRFEVVPSA